MKDVFKFTNTETDYFTSAGITAVTLFGSRATGHARENFPRGRPSGEKLTPSQATIGWGGVFKCRKGA